MDTFLEGMKLALLVLTAENLIAYFLMGIYSLGGLSNKKYKKAFGRNLMKIMVAEGLLLIPSFVLTGVLDDLSAAELTAVRLIMLVGGILWGYEKIRSF